MTADRGPDLVLRARRATTPEGERSIEIESIA